MGAGVVNGGPRENTPLLGYVSKTMRGQGSTNIPTALRGDVALALRPKATVVGETTVSWLGERRSKDGIKRVAGPTYRGRLDPNNQKQLFFTYLLTYLPTYLLTYLLTYLTYLLAYLPTSFPPSFLPSFVHSFLPSCLPSFLPCCVACCVACLGSFRQLSDTIGLARRTARSDYIKSPGEKK